MMDHIEILFKEYDTLRAEIVSRTTNVYELIAVVAGAAAWLVARGPKSWHFVAFASIISAFFMVLFFVISRDIFYASARIQELEREINSIAGKELLRWESVWGAGSPNRRAWFYWIFRRAVKRKLRG